MTLRRVETEAQPMRIAMVAPCAFPSLRGSQVLIRELAQGLADHGHEVHVVTYPYGDSLAAIGDIAVHRVRAPRFAAIPTAVGWRKLILDLCLAVTLYRVVRRHRIQVIHAHNYEGPLISYLVRGVTGVPVVYHSHNALSDELVYYFKPGHRQSVARWLGRALDRQVPRRADYTIALTAELERFLCRCGVRPGRIAVIPPAPVPAMAPEQLGRRSDFCADRFVVMYTGNLDPYQDLDVLVRGFVAFHKEVSRALLVIVTHESNWVERIGGRLDSLVRAGHAHVVVAPAFAIVRRLLPRANVLVCPRSSWSGFPIKLVNYMASGRPVVAAAGSAKGIVAGETGMVFRNGDAADLAAVLRRLFMDAELSARLGDNARVAAAAADDWQRAISQVEGIYASVCARRQPGQRRRSGVRPGRSWRLIPFSRNRISVVSQDRAG